MRIILLFVLTVLVTAVNFTILGFTFACLWLWFVVPVTGVSAITIPQSIGIILVIRFFAMVELPSKSTKKRIPWTQRLLLSFTQSVVISALSITTARVILFLTQ